MINIKNIIIDAWKIASLVSDYDVPDGNQTQIGINELNDIIYNLNLDNYMPFTRNTLTSAAPSLDTITIGTSGCDLTSETPIMLQKVYIKSADDSTYFELKRVAYEDIFGFKANATGIPSLFSYDRTWPNGRIVFNVKPTPGSILTIIYNKQLPEVTVNSTVEIPNEYGDLLKNLLATTLMRRYKVDPTSIAMIEQLSQNTMEKILRRNSVDKMITYKGHPAQQNPYFNIFSPQ